MAVRRAANAGMNTMQLFTAIPKFYGDKTSIRPERAERFRAAIKATGLDPQRFVSHGAYVLNTGTPDADKWTRARDGLVKELERSALQLFHQSVSRARPLVGVRRTGIQDICAVRHEALRIETRCLDRGAEALGALGADRRFVAVKLRDRGEQLHRVHARIGGPADRHVEPTVIDGVCAQPVPH